MRDHIDVSDQPIFLLSTDWFWAADKEMGLFSTRLEEADVGLIRDSARYVTRALLSDKDSYYDVSFGADRKQKTFEIFTDRLDTYLERKTFDSFIAMFRELVSISDENSALFWAVKVAFSQAEKFCADELEKYPFDNEISRKLRLRLAQFDSADSKVWDSAYYSDWDDFLNNKFDGNVGAVRYFYLTKVLPYNFFCCLVQLANFADQERESLLWYWVKEKVALFAQLKVDESAFVAIAGTLRDVGRTAGNNQGKTTI